MGSLCMGLFDSPKPLAFEEQYRDDTHYTTYITWLGSPECLAMFGLNNILSVIKYIHKDIYKLVQKRS